MTAPPKRTRPASTGRRSNTSANHDAMTALYGKPRVSAHRLPQNWRDRLPDPANYYAKHVERVGHPNAKGWAAVRCPFHDDQHASFGVKLHGRGHWRCFAGCGHGDLVAFHQRITCLSFAAAVRDLIDMGVRP